MASEVLQAKLDRIFSAVEGVDKIVLMNTSNPDPNLFYVTGFKGVFEYNYLILDKSRALFLTSELEYETAVEQALDGIEVVKIKSTEEMREYVSKGLKDATVGINGGFLPYQIYKAIKKNYKPRKIVDVSKELSSARLVKDKEEIENLRKAVGITKWAMTLIQKEFKEGMTELELAAKFDSLSGSIGSEGPSFKTLVCFGRNSAMPHHFPDNTKLRYGDFILIDAGAKVNNYCSDITRTWIFGDEKDIKDYNEKGEIAKVVKDAQVKAIRAIKPGVTGKKIDKIARDYIDNFKEGKYKGKFIHSLGHSVGLEVHDGAGFSPNSKQRLEAGMVITAEPGIYLEGFGGVRVEDDILVTKEGALVL